MKDRVRNLMNGHLPPTVKDITEHLFKVGPRV